MLSDYTECSTKWQLSCSARNQFWWVIRNFYETAVHVWIKEEKLTLETYAGGESYNKYAKAVLNVHFGSAPSLN